MRLKSFALAVVLLLAAAPPAVQAQAPGGALRVALPFDLIDVLGGVKFKIRVPRNWNGTLLVYLQGTKVAPIPEPIVVPPVLPGSQPALEETLLSRGYALAASDFMEGAQDSLALTSYFRGRVGDPTRVILWGTSGGGMYALKMIEEFPRYFDGAIVTCAPVLGHPRNMDFKLDFCLAYAVAFGWPTEKWGPLEDLREGLTFQRDVLPNLEAPKADGSNRGGWEFVRLATGFPTEAFWGTDPMWGLPGWMLNMFFATQQREAAEAAAAGPVAQNLDHRYVLKPEEKTYLAGLGTNADDLLGKMNARTNIMAAPWARDYAERFGGLRGQLTRPVLTMHTTMDTLAHVGFESAYRAQVEAWGSQDRLVQTYVKSVGHCAFTSAQLLATLEAMERWLNTGVRPDTSFFPEDKGFDNKFVPPPWPY
jgi:pimeloyl-ACP methyl ester carboxylesterase